MQLSLETDPLPITVPRWLHDAFAVAVSESFAVSYLCGASLEGDTLRPRTETARRALMFNSTIRTIMAENRIKLGNSIPPEERENLPQLEPIRERYKRTGKF